MRQDAKLLIKLSQLNLAPLPTEVTSGDGAKVAEYLASRSVLMVPDNQKDEIVAQLQQAYDAFDGEVLAQRVKGFGLTTDEVESIVGR